MSKAPRGNFCRWPHPWESRFGVLGGREGGEGGFPRAWVTSRAFFSYLGLTSSPHTLLRVGGEGGFVNPVGACLVNRLVPRGRRQKGEKDPKAVGDELQKRPRHGRPRLPLPKVGPAQPCLHPPKHPLHHPAKPVHLGVPPLPRPYPRLLPGLAPAPKPDHRPKTLPPQRLPHLLPVIPRVRQKLSPSRGKPPQGLPPKLGVRGVTLIQPPKLRHFYPASRVMS